MIEKKWTFTPQPPRDKIEALSSAINTNKFLSAILIQRQIESFEDAKHFFRPSLSHLHDPFLMKGMEEAVGRIQKAISAKEKILIYGDYDVDGATAVALAYDFFKKFYPHVDYYVPDRYKEGYGISEAGIAYAYANGVKLIIALDCGIKANRLVKQAKDSGIDFIIGDHHLPGQEIPQAEAILDPKQSDCPYPFKELSGCGIGFKLAYAFALRNNIDEKTVFNYLDLVAVSIASDIVPITGENRILAHFGIRQLNHAPRAGLKALMKMAGLNKVDISGIVFGIGPRINASGRVDHARGSVELLLSDDENEVVKLAKHVDNNNDLRKNYDSATTLEALEMIEGNPALLNSKTTVLFKKDWQKGVIGIVASRCIEKYYRPTIIFTEYDSKVTGSARSVHGFDIYEAISECAELLEQFGGHKYAAGLTIDAKNIAAFQKKFEEVVCKRIQPDHLIPQVVIDQVISLDRINHKFYNVLRQFAPFGPGNMNPVFASDNLQLKGEPQLIKDQHLKFFVKQAGSSYALEAIGFDMGHFYDKLKQCKTFKMAYSVEINDYKGYSSIQLYIRDIKFE